jgi:glycosyltransferase involved in cell wall biosynthesis
MVRVLHIIDHLGLGGAQTAVLDMLRNRDRTRFEVEAAVMHGWGPFAEALEGIGVRVHSLSTAKWPPLYIPAFLRLIRNGRYDVLHFHLQASNWIAKPLAALAGAPVRIAHDHTSGDLKFRGVASLVPDAATHLFSTRVIAVSEGVRDFLMRWEAVPGDKVEVIANGVDDTSFRPAEAGEKSAARARLGLPVGAFVAGAMGRLAYEKNFALLPELARRQAEVFFAVAGSGPEEDRLTALAKDLGVGDRVIFCGSVSDRAGFYHALDAFVLPSLHEGLPMVLLEAMSSGVPVLASRLEGIAAALREEEEGLLAEAGDSGDFSGQFSRLLADPDLRGRLAAAGRRKVAVMYSASRTARRIEAVYSCELGIDPAIAPPVGPDKKSPR